MDEWAHWWGCGLVNGWVNDMRMDGWIIASVAYSSRSAVTVTHCNLPWYIGVTLDRTVAYKAHI